jgi:arylsulfatase
MKSLKTATVLLGILSIVFCTQAAAAQKGGGANAVPYPIKEWKGVQGITLAESKPDFIGQPKAPDGAPN